MYHTGTTFVLAQTQFEVVCYHYHNEPNTSKSLALSICLWSCLWAWLRLALSYALAFGDRTFITSEVSRQLTSEVSRPLRNLHQFFGLEEVLQVTNLPHSGYDQNDNLSDGPPSHSVQLMYVVWLVQSHVKLNKKNRSVYHCADPFTFSLTSRKLASVFRMYSCCLRSS